MGQVVEEGGCSIWLRLGRSCRIEQIGNGSVKLEGMVGVMVIWVEREWRREKGKEGKKGNI